MLNLNLNDAFALLCIGVITAVPFYFRYWVKSAEGVTEAQIDQTTSLFTVFIFIALFAGAFVFPGTSRKTGEVMLFASIVSFSFLYQFRSNALQNDQKQKEQNPKINLRASAAQLLLVFLIVGISAGMKSFWAIPAFLISIPFLMPLFCRLQWASQKMQNSPFKDSIFRIFKNSGIQLQEVYLTELNGQNKANAFVTGSRFGRGAFGRTLFITLPLLESLHEEELHAVLLHEAAHFQLHHIPKRIFWSMAMMLLSVFWIAVPISLLFRDEFLMIGLATLITCFVQFYLLGRVIYRQEMEADLGAARNGASSDALISALKKISGRSYHHESNILSQMILGLFYPSGAEREKTIRLGEIPSGKTYLPYKPYAFAYSLFVMGFLFWSAQNYTPDLNRTPASLVGKDFPLSKAVKAPK